MESIGMDYILNLEENKITFHLLGDNNPKSKIILKMGYRTIAQLFFKQNIPTEAEMDYAINFIEEELMRDRRLIGEKGELLTSFEPLAEIFRKNNLLDKTISRRRVEDLFTAYAEVIMGARTSLWQAEITAEDVALILLMREIMYHLDFQVLIFTTLEA